VSRSSQEQNCHNDSNGCATPFSTADIVLLDDLVFTPGGADDVCCPSHFVTDCVAAKFNNP
jgi:hypothetical protein